MCAFLSPHSRWNYLFRNRQKEADNEQEKKKGLEHPFNVTEWRNVDSDNSFSHLLPGCLSTWGEFLDIMGTDFGPDTRVILGAQPDPPVRLKKVTENKANLHDLLREDQEQEL